MSVEQKREATKKNRRRVINITLWVLALVLTLASAVYQRMTGPTHPKRVSYSVAGETQSGKLIRSGTTGEDAEVSIPDADGVGAFLYYKRYKTDDEYAVAQMHRNDGRFKGFLPTQPMAGKLEYYIELKPEAGPGDPVRVPSDRSVVIRFKGAVPPGVLMPHVLLMFIAMLFGMRVLLEAITNRPGLRWLTWTAFGTTLLGGMILGPAVQQYAFGAAWTGVPFGWDLTDNKTLLAFIFWIIAVWAVGIRGEIKPRGRWLALLAAVVMIVVYLIPHSMYGSELDYEKLEQGVSAEEAIGQG